MRASVEMNAEFNPAAFTEGVSWGNERGLAEALFGVRTRAVLGKRPLAENTSFFSGLLVGAEVSRINTHAANTTVVLAASGRLAELYQLALKTIASPALHWIQVPVEQSERAVISAHALLLERTHKPK